jgi:hypothetical protein
MAALLPLAETVLLGGVDGALRAADNKAGRTTHLKQWSTWLEAGLVAAGAVAAMQRVHSDIWEPAVIGGLFALSQRGGAWIGHQAGIGGADGLGVDGSFGFSNGGLGGRAAPARMGQAAMGYGYRPFGGPDPGNIPVAFPTGQHVLPAGSLA